MTNNGWTSDQAFKEMKSYKFGADFLHSEFKRFVYAFRPGQPSTAPTIPGGVLATTAPGIE
jgi:hypothetical protein